MNILWLPHAPLHTGRTRTDHLVERLADRHHITMVSFRIHPPSRPWLYFCDLATHRSRRGKPYDELATWRLPRALALDGWLLNRAIRHELSQRPYDVLVVAPAPYVTGYLDFASLRTRGLRIVCDYLDGGDWVLHRDDTAFERLYVQSADAVICVSKGLLRQALSVNPRCHYVPNGVELARYRSFRAAHTARECKALLGIDPDAFVVSIIGMTFSRSLYFLDAVISLARRGKNVILLLVGASPLLAEIERRAGEWRRVVRAVGPVPYTEIMPYFMATDLGLSPVDDHPYYHFQSPLKIFEYGAMGKPVLASPKVEEVAETGLSHLRFCEADADSVERAIETMMQDRQMPSEPDLEAYDWSRLAGKVETILSGVVGAT